MWSCDYMKLMGKISERDVQIKRVGQSGVVHTCFPSTQSDSGKKIVNLRPTCAK